jgi:site-specific DNA-cytosine methylase
VSGLVLSLFSGMGALDEGFRREGWCMVSAGDVAWSSLYDVRHFHPPPGVFEGVIGGDPCQSHSALANLVRAKGLEPSFPDLTGEFTRVVEEARPLWFLRENVPQAPDPKPAGYDVRSFLLDHSTMDSGDGTGHEQMRRRRFWFGTRDRPCPELRAHIDFALFVLPEQSPVAHEGGGAFDDRNRKPAVVHAAVLATREREKRPRRVKSVCADARDTFIPGGQAEVDAIRRGEIEKVDRSAMRRTHAVDGSDGGEARARAGHPSPAVTTRTAWAPLTRATRPATRSTRCWRYRGLQLDVFEHSPLTMQGKRKLVGNAVALPMSEALARAVRYALEPSATPRPCSGSSSSERPSDAAPTTPGSERSDAPSPRRGGA